MHVYTGQITRKGSKQSHDGDLWGTGFCAAFNSRRTARAITNLYDSTIQVSGIRSTQLAILIAIAKSGKIAMGRLADALILDPTTLTRSIRRMQRLGLVTVSGRSVGRQRFITLSAKGRKQLSRSVSLWRQVQKQFVSRVGQKTWVLLQRKLEELALLAIDLEKSNRRGSRPRRSRQRQYQPRSFEYRPD